MMRLTYPSHRDYLGESLIMNGMNGTGVEVGVERGVFSSKILNSGWVGNLVGVDTWAFNPSCKDDAIYNNRAHLGSGQYRFLQKPSVEAAKEFTDHTLDFVYIDADHDYENVRQDINAWLPKVMKGGLLCGHDFWWGCGVPQAVMELALDRLKTEFFVTPCTSWWIWI